MGKPLTRESLNKYTPSSSLQCPFCFLITSMPEIKMVEECKEKDGVIEYIKQSYICPCGKEIMSVTGKE